MVGNMPPQGSLSMPAQQAATQYRLGAFIKGYKANRIRYISIAVIGALMMVFFVCLALQNISEDQSPTTYILLALIGLVLLIFMVYMYIHMAGQQVFLFQQGFIIENKDQIQVFPWNQITEVCQNITRHYRNGIYVGTTYRYRLRRADGHQIKLNNSTKGIAELGRSIALGITQELVPRALYSIRAGQTLTFARFTINQQGMGNGRDFIPWQEVQEVNVNRGYIKIKKAGKFFSWGTVRVSSIPNFLVFTAVADEMIRQFNRGRR